eukprot:jgi/Tetstr1/448164/TSEL_035455.t1
MSRIALAGRQLRRGSVVGMPHGSAWSCTSGGARWMSVHGWGEGKSGGEKNAGEGDPTADFTGRRISRWEKSTNFPDYIEAWGRRPFYITGAAGTAATVGLFAWLGAGASSPWVLGGLMGAYWWQGLHDVAQESHTIKHNYPVLGNVRYILETVRPEIRQYFVEGDLEAAPFSRRERTIVYQRAKSVQDSMPFGTRLQVYHDGYEFITHSMWPVDLHSVKNAGRVLIGGRNPECTQPYLSSIFNVSAMSYGALSDNAILALNTAAKMGGFSHNTGEGGISKFHLQPGGDIVWNVGTGYFGCRTPDGRFCPDMFRTNATRPNVKMIEIKLSQGAKPAHGGMLPGSKVTPEIAEARGIEVGQTCNSPPVHSAFTGPAGLVGFIRTLRGLSGGKPVGFKLCIGKPEEFAAVVHAMLREQCYPDFITVDGAEGGTGAAPPEFSNSVGMPLRDALSFVNDLLTGAGIRDKITVISSGKSLTGFSLVRNMALGADVCNSARAMMFALGCIQALKCNTNHCPTGITTLDKKLMAGLNVDNKSTRVYNYHKKTVETALEIMGAAGAAEPMQVTRDLIMMRPDGPMSLISYAELYPYETPGSLTTGLASPKLSHTWLNGEHILKSWDAKLAAAET